MSKPEKQDLTPEDFHNALKDLDTYIDVTVDDLMSINHMAQKHAWLRQVEQLKVRDIMTAEITSVTPDTGLREAARILLERRISGLPVVDEQNRLAGVVTEADFLSALGLPGHHATHHVWQTLENIFKHTVVQENIPDRVADIMTTEAITISGDNTVQDVIQLMKKHNIKRVIVTDGEQRVQGIVTRSNLVQVMLQQLL